MRNVWTIAQKELRSYFYSPVAYVVLFIFLIVMGLLYSNIVAAVNQASMQMMRFQGGMGQFNPKEVIFRQSFSNMIIILLLLIPLLTMRLFTEEKKMKTSELLFTSPITVFDIIFGKFLGALLLYLLMLILTFYIPLLIANVAEISWKTVLSGYLGLLLCGGVFLAWGILASSLTENQIISAVISFGFLLSLWIIGFMGQVFSDTPIGTILTYLSLITHFENFSKGLIDTSDIAYAAGMIALGLFVTYQVVDSQRWKS
ncbi:MAG: ABC transporter permease subunit [Nitrospiria bacterium]